MHRILVVNLAYQRRQGPEFLLRVWRVRSDVDNVFLNLGNLRGTEEEIILYIDKLFDKGVASLFDVSPNGSTCLHVWQKDLFRLDGIEQLMLGHSMRWVLQSTAWQNSSFAVVQTRTFQTHMAGKARIHEIEFHCTYT